MATVTSVQSGNWSSSLTWGGLLPANGDTVVISAGHTVVFDVDMSSWANGVILRVYGKLVAPTAAGSYYLKLAGNSTVYNGGKIEWGTQQSPVPVTITMTLDFNNYVLDGDSHRGQLEIVCTDPPDAAKVAKFTAAASAGATRIYIDRDLRGQTYWQAGAYIFMTNPQRGNTEYKTVSAVGENYIDLSSGLSSSKTATAVLALCTRNIIFKNMKTGSSSSVSNFANVKIAAYKESAGDRIYTGTAYTGQIIGGSYIGGSSYSLVDNQNITNAVTIDGKPFDYGSVYCYNTIIIGMLGAYCGYAFLSDCVVYNSYGIYRSLNLSCVNTQFVGTKQIERSVGAYLYNCTLSDISIFNFHGTLYNVVFTGSSSISNSMLRCFNCVLPASTTIDCIGYYIESYNHNQTAGAFMARSQGGTCESISDPRGGSETGWLKLSLNSSAYAGFWQIRHVVLPGKKISVTLDSIVNSVPDAKVQIVKISSDPIHLSTAQPLAEVSLSDGMNTITWRNTETSPVEVFVRVLGTSANGNINFRIARWS